MFKQLFAGLARSRQRRTFAEYGHHVDQFNLGGVGTVEFAQWEHPFVKPFTLTAEVVDFYRQLIKPGDFVIDIGAHIGDTTVPMALAAGPTGTVLALEPNRYVFKVLEKNASLNRSLTNIHPLCMAATAEDGAFTFNYSDASFCNGGFLSEREKQDRHHRYPLEVQGRNLERILYKDYLNKLPMLRFIKVDAEGYDKEIIKTLSNVIKEYRPMILSECNVFLTASERDELYDVMTQHDYELYSIHEDADRDQGFRGIGSPITRQDMHKQKHFDVLAKAKG